MMRRGAWIAILGGVIAALFVASCVQAARFTSSSYVIDASVNNTFGGQSGSTSYSLVASGGEPVIGNGAGGSYKIGMGYTAQLISSLQLDVSPTDISFPALISGSPQTAGLTVGVQTDAPGYSLGISQNRNLQDGSNNTIPKITGTIDTPTSWQTGTTVGLGFTISSTPTGVPAKWTGPKYAQFPDSSSPTVFYTRSGTIVGTDTIGLTYSLDVAQDQPAGTYTNTTTIVGTMLP